MTQPTDDLIIWASSDVNLPNLASPNKSRPIDDLINKGWDFTEKPAADEFNYILNNLGLYIQYLQEIIEEGTSSNVADTLVRRDSSGNFSAGTVTARLSGNSSTATTLQTARTINGTSFDGSTNITTNSWGTSRNLAFTGFATGNGNVDGSGNVSIELYMGSGFTNSKNANGYTYLPNGIILQWGYVGVVSAGGTRSVTFPVSFPNACFQVFPTLVGVAEGTITYVKTSSSSNGGAVIFVDADNGTGVSWFAIGY